MCALLATGLTIEIILWITAIYIMDGGLIRQIGAMGLYITNISVITSRQSFVSDLSTTPLNVTTFFVPNLLSAWVLINAILFMVTFGFFVINLRVISKLDNPREQIWEYLV